MKFKISAQHPRGIVKSIAQQLSLTSKADCLEEILELPKQQGTGKIVGFNFKYGIGLIVVNCRLKEDWILIFENEIPPLIFKFNASGDFWHSIDADNVQYQLNPFQGTISATPAGTNQKFEFPAGIDLTFAAILIERTAYLKKVECMVDQLPAKLMEVFSDVEAKHPFFYQSNYSIASAGCIKKIVSNKNKALVRSTFVEAKALELLSKQIKQFTDDSRSPSRKVTLRRYDVEKIQKARDILVEDLKNPPIIENLARLAAINRQKLKSGFKLVYDATINEYLRNERLEKASMLLLQGSSVGEAAEHVGYSNQSHFARRFKEKYGVLPKDYLKSVSTEINV